MKQPGIKLSNGSMMPKLGQGTWYMGEKISLKKEEIESLQLGIRLGMTMIDTAEMYGSGASEKLVGEAIKEQKREELFLVSKVYPHNAGRDRIFKSCENSLKRLGTSYLDLYLLHWRGNISLKETAACMEELKNRGLIRQWGVSNFDTDDMEELWTVPKGDGCVVNQVLYHLGSRGIEYSLLPWMKEHGVALMAYCPMAQAGTLKAGILKNRQVLEVARRHGISAEQVLLSFVLHDQNIAAIPKASKKEHTRQNASAAEIVLTEEEMELLSFAYPKPVRKEYLDIV